MPEDKKNTKIDQPKRTKRYYPSMVTYTSHYVRRYDPKVKYANYGVRRGMTEDVHLVNI